ncbi:hypothetical protein Y032_0407g905 [Ancylostoma ceylanicum]|uniref:Uncharacterized protein n=1 Tax=Ancylostoma ceylanicum TaxID=53326 RepID=A0A016X2Q5_9BILA|nr:hypothetical protein Y032_0407g905 [Ancylostoma ceylanicum]
MCSGPALEEETTPKPTAPPPPCRKGFFFNEENNMCYTFYPLFDRVNLTNFFECSLDSSLESQQEAMFVRGILENFNGQLLGCRQPSNREYLIGRIRVDTDGSKFWTNCQAANYFRDKNDIKWKLGSNYLFALTTNVNIILSGTTIWMPEWTTHFGSPQCFYVNHRKMDVKKILENLGHVSTIHLPLAVALLTKTRSNLMDGMWQIPSTLATTCARNRDVPYLKCHCFFIFQMILAVFSRMSQFVFSASETNKASALMQHSTEL